MSDLDDLTRLEDWAGPLLSKLQPAERRTLTRSLARDLRRRQQQRIARQQNPDGSLFSPRRAQQRQGRIKRKAMFVKLRQARFMKAQGDANEIAIGFVGRIAKIARVHQLGLEDRAAPGGPKVNYQQRELLGFSADDLQFIESQLLQYLTGSL